MMFKRLIRFWVGATLIVAGIVTGGSLDDALGAQGTTRLEGRVLDAETRRLIPARVYIRAENGDWFFPKSISDEGSAVEYRKQRAEQSHEMHTTLSAHPYVPPKDCGRADLPRQRFGPER